MRLLLIPVSVLGLLISICPDARADLSRKQAQKLISRLGGAQLSGSAVRVERFTENGAMAEASAEIETAFRLEQDEQGQWQVREVRTGPNQWEYIGLILAAIGTDTQVEQCGTPDLVATKNGSGPGAKRARCLLAALLAVRLPSDDVRIRSVSQSGMPFANTSSAIVVARIRLGVRFSKGPRAWQVSALRSGDREWMSLDTILAGVDDRKRNQAREDLAAIGRALDAFRQERGFYVVSESEAALIDHLCPQYLARIIRLDPWHQPYHYQGERDRFVLSSWGSDGKQNTPDDVTMSSSSR